MFVVLLRIPVRLTALGLALLSIAAGAIAAERPLDTEDLSLIVDLHINHRLQQESVPPAELVGDAAFARRVMLDLAGRVPTETETRAFLDSTHPLKRERLVDRLLSSPDYDIHLRNELDLLLLARIKQDDSWRKYLLDATRENRRWDQVFREIMVPDRQRPGDAGPAAFLRERVKDLDTLTNDTSSLLFGVNISCAKCHDHPLVSDWEQRHYYGMASFFKRTYKTKSDHLAEQFDGGLTFTDVLGNESAATFTFLNGDSVEEPETGYDQARWSDVKEQIKQAQKDAEADPPPLPEFSPRVELVRLAVEPGGANYLARNIVNRTWARLMGRGLVHPLDQMHSENAPTHPELLDWLAEDFCAHEYNLKRLIRGLVLSETYARSSFHPGVASMPPELFAVAVPRPLTPRQLTASLAVAIRCSELSPDDMNTAEWLNRREALEDSFGGIRDHLEVPDANFQVGAEEALLFSNSEIIEREVLQETKDRLVGRLNQIDDLDVMIETAYLAVLSRRPDAKELHVVADYIIARSDRRLDAIKQVVWALVTSPEFRFNH